MKHAVLFSECDRGTFITLRVVKCAINMKNSINSFIITDVLQLIKLKLNNSFVISYCNRSTSYILISSFNIVGFVPVSAFFLLMHKTNYNHYSSYIVQIVPKSNLDCNLNDICTQQTRINVIALAIEKKLQITNKNKMKS